MSRKNDRLYFFWSVAIFLCLVLVLFSLVFVSCKSVKASEPDDSPDPSLPASGEKEPGSSSEPDQEDITMPPVTDTPGEDESNNPDIVAEAGPTKLGETEDMGQEYLDKIIFLGDSTTNGLAHYGLLSGGSDTRQVWVPANGTLTLNQQSFINIVYPDTGEEITIAEAVSRKKPEMMVITLGVNGISFMDEEYFKNEYRSLINTIKDNSPDTRIILNSMYPVAESYQDKAEINNSKINQGNWWIEELAQETGTRFLNSCSVLKNENGVLPEELQNGDGMHLEPAGYEKVLHYIRTHGYK